MQCMLYYSNLVCVNKEIDEDRCICMRDPSLAIMLWMTCHYASSYVLFTYCGQSF